MCNFSQKGVHLLGFGVVGGVTVIFERLFHTNPHMGGPKGSLGRIKTAQGHTQNLRSPDF